MAAQLRREGRTRAVELDITGIMWVGVMLYVLISCFYTLLRCCDLHPPSFCLSFYNTTKTCFHFILELHFMVS